MTSDFYDNIDDEFQDWDICEICGDIYCKCCGCDCILYMYEEEI